MNNTTQTKPKISVCIFTYNRATFLNEAVQSILDQTYKDFELLVIDDGSTDNTFDLISSIKDSRLRYIKKAHTGAPDTRNRAIREANGKFLIWLGSDDILMPNTVTKYMNAIYQYPEVDVFYGDLIIMDREGVFIRELKYPDFYNQNAFLLHRFLLGCSLPDGGSLINKRLYQKFGGYNLDFKRAHDYQFWSRVVDKITVKHIGSFVYKWRWHETNMSSGSVDFDTSYDIEIKKSILGSHSIKELFPQLNWNEEKISLETAYFTIGNSFNQLKGYQKAIEYYEKCIEINKSEACFCALGLTYFQTENLEKSIWAFNEALKINPCNDKAKEISENLNKILCAKNQTHPIQSVTAGIDEAHRRCSDVEIGPLVSIIVPTINRPEMLKETLQSILHQTYQNFEVMVVNDGGDNVSEIISRLNDKRIKYLEHKIRKGSAAAKNSAIRSAKGKYIAYLDDDDIFYPEHLERLVHELEIGEHRVVYSDSLEVSQVAINESYKTVRKRLVYSHDYDRELLRKTNYIPILNLMHHRNCVDKIGLFDENLRVLEDWDFWIRLSEHYDFKHIPKVTAEYRVRNDYSNATTIESHHFPVCREQIKAKLAVSANRPMCVENPLVSIVILVCNQLDYTRECLDSILKHTKLPFEIIIVDNGSSDGTPEFLASLFEKKSLAGRLKVIKNKENKGFAGGNNQGIGAATGDYILLLNNDVVVTPGWLERLIRCAERNSKIGIVGPCSNQVSGTQLVKDVTYNLNTLDGLSDFSNSFADKFSGQAESILRVVGFCMLIKRAVIDKIGGMDDRYGLGNFEDDDFSLRAAVAGFESWIAQDCFIHHFGHRTFIGEQIDLQKSLLKNWEVFKEKWGLPVEKPYGSPYRISEMKNTRFDPSIHYYPFEKENAAMKKSDKDSKTAEELYSTIHANLNIRSSKEVIEALRTLIASYPEFGLAYNDLGVLYYNSGNKEQALQYYKKAVQLDPENANFNKNLADYYYVEQGRVEDALQIYVKILEAHPTDVETLLITGHICVSLHQFEDAQVFYRRVLELEPLNEAARENLEKLNKIESNHTEFKTAEDMYQEILPLLNNGDPQKAIASLTELLGRFPEFALGHNDLGVLYYHMGDKNKTRHHYKRAVELMPENITFKKNLADFYCIELGRIEDALQIYVSILKTNPQDIETLMATGQICVALEKPDDARDFFNQVLEIEPWNENAGREIEKMEKQVSEATINSESAEDAYRRFRTELNNLAPAEAVEDLKKIVEIYPDFAIGHNDLGVLYYNAGNEEKALHHYEQAAHLQPQNLTLQKNLADFLFVELKKVEEALQIYMDILATHPDDVETLLIVGHICVALKKFDDAKDFYRRVLALEPDNKDANTNLQILVNGQSGRPLARANTINDETVSDAKEESTDLNKPESEKQFAESKTSVSMVINLDGIPNRVKECLKSIQAHTPEAYELLFVDRGAPKGLLKWAQQFVKDNSNCQIIQCASQAGWAESINQAIQKAGGDVIVLMHNDVVLPVNWLKALKMCINLESNTGLVGPMSNRATGIQQLFHSDESERVEFESAAKAFYEQNQYRRVPARKLSDFCIAFRHELPAKIGYFDEHFVSQSVCIEDFCQRAAAKGYRNLVAADTYVYHYDQHSTRKSTSKKNPAGAEDWKKYQKKWNDADNPETKAFQMVQLVARADELSQKGQFDAAAETVLVGIGARPEDKNLYYALSEISLAGKRFQDAKDALTEMPPTDGYQEMRKAELLGYAEEGLANYESAKTCVEEMLAINPNHAPALNLKGILAYRNADHRSAEQYFKRAIDADPGYGEPYTNLGMLQFEVEQQERALKFFEKGFRLTPTDLDIATNYHSLISAITEYEKAENLARKASALYPNNQKIKYMLIDFLVQQGKYEMAMPEIEDAILKFGIDDGILGAALKVREKQGPMILKPSSEKATVSCCMIIKDEEKYLARCLASVKPIVDEIIVVDTGSSDRSINIATAFGARVFKYDWGNDFADARNFSISKASGEWILILDGDEVISPLDHAQFSKMVKKTPLAPIAYSITTRNYNKLANIVGWVPNDGLYPVEEAAIGWLPSEKVRLFYGKDQIWFEGAVHELVDPVLKRNGIEIKKCSIPVHHYGRLDKEKLDRKGEIYFDIGQKKLSEMGDDLNALRELAVQATILEKNQEAFELWRRLLALNPNSHLAAVAYVNMGTIYNRLGKFEDALDASKKAVTYDPDLKEAHYNYAMAELHAGKAQQTVRVLEHLLDSFSDYPPAQFILSAAYLCVGQKEKGLEGITKLKATPVGAHLDIPFLELAQSLVSARKIEYALCVLGAAIESDIINKEILDLFNKCIQMNNEARNIPEISPTVMNDRQVVKFDNLPQ